MYALLDRETEAGRIATICKMQICVRLYKTDLNDLSDRCGAHMYRPWQ